MTVTQELRSRAKVFLSYSQRDPNAEVVRAVHTALVGQHDVFCDLGIEPGDRWASEIETKLAEADYFVVFLSAEAAKSKFVAEEVRLSVKREEQTGQPRILTVPVAYDAANSGYEFGALLHNYDIGIFWRTPEDTPGLIDELDRVFSGGWTAPAADIAPALSRYLVSATRNKRIQEAFVAPPDAENARSLLRSAQILWITGAAGAGKRYLANALASELEKQTFELRRPLSWQHIVQKRPAHAVLVLPDALAPERAGTDDYEAALSNLLNICKTDNVILLTCTDDEYAMRKGQMIEAGFTPEMLSRYQLTGEAYSLALRKKIVLNVAAQCHSDNTVSLAQCQWLEKALERQQPPWKGWALAELESFVTLSLAAVKDASDIDQLLDRHTTIKEQVHTWFLRLGEPARALLLTLRLFPEASSEQIWFRFRAILSELENLRLVPRMSIPTLGICRHQCEPYITKTDDLDIVDPEVALAIARELAVSWREYVIELRELLIRWSVPAHEERAAERSADATVAVRQEVARFIGELLSFRVEDVLPFLEDFMSSDQPAVRRAAAEAIVYAFGSEDGARNGRKLLQAWESDRSGENAAIRRREIGANACWRIAAVGKSSADYAFALEQLQRYTRDAPRVRAEVAYGIGRIVNHRNINDLRPMMTRLALDQNVFVRRRTGVALSKLSERASGDAEAIFAEWFASADTRRMWTAAYALLVAARPVRGDREKLRALMGVDAEAFAEALASSLTPGDKAKDTDRTEHAARHLFRLLSDAELRRCCAIALGTYWAAQPDRGAALCKQLGDLAADNIDTLLIDAYRLRILKSASLSQFQTAVLGDVSAGGYLQNIATQAVAGIISELPNGIEIDPKIAEAWHDAPDLFERFLQWLRRDTGDVGRQGIIIYRRQILQSLFRKPEFVKCASGWVRSPETSGEAKEAIRAITMAPELWAHLVAPLAIDYWNLRSDVWLILEGLDPRTSIAVRQWAFARILDEDDRKFISAAIEETQDHPQIRGEVLMGLAEVAKTKGPAIAAAVRRFILPSNRRKILKLIGDFRVSEPPLKKVAENLRLLRLWLSFVQMFSRSDT